MNPPASLQNLIEALRILPGVGPKAAARMAYHLLQRDRPGADKLALSLNRALAGLRHCRLCNSFAESEICELCANPRRDPALLAVVEMPTDLAMMEAAQTYAGRYFVLMGRLSPLDGVGPRDIALDRLIERALDGVVREVVLATNFTPEGEATAHTIAALLKARDIAVSRLARGVPLGGELEYVDSGTLAQAYRDRRSL